MLRRDRASSFLRVNCIAVALLVFVSLVRRPRRVRHGCWFDRLVPRDPGSSELGRSGRLDPDRHLSRLSRQTSRRLGAVMKMRLLDLPPMRTDRGRKGQSCAGMLQTRRESLLLDTWLAPT